MKILSKKKRDEICERELNNALIITDAYLYHDLPYGNLNMAIDNAVNVIGDIGGKKWLKKANDIYQKKVSEAKEKVPVDK